MKDPILPKVSIVLPTYNGSRYIRQSIDSCLNQTYNNIELIIVDDCSNDETPSIIKSYSDQRIKVIRNKQNMRLPCSLNVGFKHATGEYLTWTSDDNQYLPNAIEVMIHCLNQNKNIDFVYADYWECNLGNGEKKIRRLPDKVALEKECQIGACFLYSRRVFSIIGWYNPKLELVEDYDYWIRVSKKFNLFHCSDPLYIYTFHSNSLTGTKPDMQVLFDKILKFKYSYLSLHKLGKSILEFIDYNVYTKKRKEALGAILRAMFKIYQVSFIAGFLFLGSFIYFIVFRIFKLVLKKMVSV